MNAQFNRLLDYIENKLPKVFGHLDAACVDILHFTAFPKVVWQQVWSNSPNERVNKETRRRTDVVGISPNRGEIVRRVGAVPDEQSGEWAEGRRYFGLEVRACCRLTTVNSGLEPNTDLLELETLEAAA